MAIEIHIAEELDSENVSHTERAAEIVMDGGIVAYPYNGVFGLFGNIDNPEAVEKIHEAKARPRDKKLVATYLPEYIQEIADAKRLSFPLETINSIWREVHALGLILPASTHAPYNLVIGNEVKGTILSIWTEYAPLRYMVEHVRKLGGRGLVATSANKSGQATHWQYEELYADFRYDVEGIMKADFSSLPEVRRKSTSIVDLTNTHPRLHREGNVPEEELREILNRYNLSLVTGRDVIVVRSRGENPNSSLRKVV